jgi:hypothetical protein
MNKWQLTSMRPGRVNDGFVGGSSHAGSGRRSSRLMLAARKPCRSGHDNIADLSKVATKVIRTREDAVQSLVRFDGPVDALREILAGFPFDWDGLPLASLERNQVLKVLTRWQRG